MLEQPARRWPIARTRRRWWVSPQLFARAAMFLPLLLALACQSSLPTPTPPLPPIPTPTATPVSVQETPPGPAPTIGEGAEPPALAEALFLEVVSPNDETVVAEEVVTVRGTTTPSAVVSVNGYAVYVDALGSFAAPVVLTEGPNLIEVVASDLVEQARHDLALIYLPG